MSKPKNFLVRAFYGDQLFSGDEYQRIMSPFRAEQTEGDDAYWTPNVPVGRNKRRYITIVLSGPPSARQREFIKDSKGILVLVEPAV